MKIAIVAGEASGDLHAAEVLRELKKLDPSLDAQMSLSTFTSTASFSTPGISMTTVSASSVSKMSVVGT